MFSFLTWIIHSFSYYESKLLATIMNAHSSRLKIAMAISMRLIAVLLNIHGTFASHDEKQMNNPG